MSNIKESAILFRLGLVCLLLSFIIALSPPFTNKVSAAIAQVNSVACSNNGATSISCTVSSPTDGNTLIAVVGARNSASGSITSISQTGATWVQAATSVNASGMVTDIWYANNVSSAGTGVTINLSGSYKASAIIGEYSGLLTSSVLDKTATTTGSGTSPSSGTTATTATPDQLWIGGMGNQGNDTYSSPTNSFTLVGESGSGGGPPSGRNNAAMYSKTVASTGTANVGATLSGSQQWAGAIATFKGVAVPTQINFTTSQRTLTAGSCSGAGNVITFEAQDSGGSPAAPSNGTVIRITSNSPAYTIYSDISCSTTVTNGDFTFNGSETSKSFYIIDTRKSAATWTLTAAKQSGPESLTSGNQSITINAAAVSRLVITLPGQTFTDGTGNSGSASNRTAGSSFTITKISATDQYFNVNTGYSGSKTLVYSGPANAPNSTPPSYTTSVSFTSGQSTTTLTTTLYKAESTTITATDSGSYGYASSSVTVDPGILDNFSVTTTTTVIAGSCTSGTVTARDAWNNNRTSDTSTVLPSHSGTAVSFYTTGGCGSTAASYVLSGGTQTFYWSTNKKQSSFTITMTKSGDTPTGTTASITVDPAAVSALLIRLPGQTFTDGTGISGSTNFTGLRTPNATAGTSYTFDIKAVDVFNNLVSTGTNNYTGSKTISFASSTAGNAPDSSSPSFPGSPVSFTNGAANGLSATYVNAATGRNLRADDTGTPVTGTASTSFTVQAAAANDYSVSASSSQVAGVPFNVTITARDSYQNLMGSLYSAPSGTYTWSSTASAAPDTTAPSIGTLVQGNFSNGVATKSVTLYKAESGVTFTANEPPSSSVGGTTGSITVSAGSISANVSDSSVDGTASATTGSPVTATITLLDTWRNPKVGVAAGNITVSATGSPSITQPSSATNGSGQTTADLTWAATGTQIVSVQISGVSLVQNDGSTADADGYLDDTYSIDLSLPAGSGRLRGGTTIRGGTTLQ